MTLPKKPCEVAFAGFDSHVCCFNNPVSPFGLRAIRDGGNRRKQAHQDCVHARTAPGAGEGVSVQPLHLQAAARRAGADPEPHRAPHQDLVSEPAHEVEEGGGPEEGEGR